jgi:hypothetical protein
MLERNITNENQEINDKKNLDSYSYIINKNHNFISSVKDEDNKLFLGSRNCIKEESNNPDESNIHNLELTHNNMNINQNLNDENKSHQITENVPLEELFLKQKEKIQLYKEKNKNKNNTHKSSEQKKNARLNNVNNINNLSINGKQYKHQRKIFNGTFKNITLDNYQFLEKSSFKIAKSSNSDDNIPKLKNVDWKSLNKSIANFELSGMALRTINEINYDTNMVEIKVKFTLESNSEFWIFTRSYINKDFNESFNFDISSVNNEPDIVFNKYSSLIKIINEKRCSNKCYVSFGAFCESSKDPKLIYYKTFLKRQLINFSDNNNSDYNDKDYCDFYVEITDTGSEIIDSKIYYNSGNKFNHVMGNFYLPINKRSKIIICGEGKSVIVRSLEIKNEEKTDELMQIYDTRFSLEQKSCSCCNII